MCVRPFLQFMGISILLLSACSKQPSECTNLEDSTQYLAKYLDKYADELENADTPQHALDHLRQIDEKSQRKIDTCTQLITQSIKNMSSEEIMRHHEAFIRDGRVSRFLDAQDRFNESADPAMVEQLDDLLSPFFLLSE